MGDDASPSCGPPDKASIEELMQKVSSGHSDEERDGAKELRRLAKLNSINRICIAEAGAIPLLIKTLKSTNIHVQTHSVSALLNLTLRNESNKQAIIMAKGLEPVVEVLENGSLQESRENAAALLFNLSCGNAYRAIIGSLEGVFRGLIDLLWHASMRGKKDAAAALFNLVQNRHNQALAVRAGAVMPLLHLVQDASSGLVDESLTVLSNLASHQEGRYAIMKALGINTLVDVLKWGTDSNMEYASAVLLVLCLEDFGCAEEACKLGAQELLINLSVSGTEKAQRKARRLVELLK